MDKNECTGSDDSDSGEVVTKKVKFLLHSPPATENNIIENDQGSGEFDSGMGDKHDNNPKVDRSAMLQIEQDEQLAKELQNQVNEEDLLDHSSSVDHPSSQNDLSSVESPSSLNDTDYVAKAVQERVNSSQKLLLVVRRGAPFFRLLALWQQEVNRSSAKYALRVCYHGEEGTDSGAMGKEFFTQMIQGTDIISSESPMLHTSLTQRPMLAMLG